MTKNHSFQATESRKEKHHKTTYKNKKESTKNLDLKLASLLCLVKGAFY